MAADRADHVSIYGSRADVLEIMNELAAASEFAYLADPLTNSILILTEDVLSYEQVLDHLPHLDTEEFRRRP